MEEDRVEIFKELMKREPGLLAMPLEDLAPLSVMGDAAVAAYRTIVSQLKKQSVGELNEQGKEAVEDGQEIARVALDIQAAVGEKLAEQMPDSGAGFNNKEKGRIAEGSGMTKKQRAVARTIARHPGAVAAVIEEAKKNEDIPTKTAVMNKVASAESSQFKKEEREKLEAEVGADTAKYLITLDQVYGRVGKVPSQLNEKGWQMIAASLRNLQKIIGEMLEQGESLTRGSDGILPGP